MVKRMTMVLRMGAAAATQMEEEEELGVEAELMPRMMRRMLKRMTMALRMDLGAELLASTMEKEEAAVVRYLESKN